MRLPAGALAKAGALAWACVLAAAPGAVHAQSPEAGAIVDRAVAYVAEFHKRFGSMVSEERYEQSVQENAGFGPRSARSQWERVELVSDFLLVQVPGEGWTPFRDVFERNGQKLRDREERLSRLFLNGSSRSSFEQARQIMLESSRYNIGNVERTINVPTLPLAFLTPQHRRRFRFELARRDDDSAVIEFTEVARPTYVATTSGRDLPVSGRFWVDEQSGAVRRSELDAVDTTVEAHIKVAYRFDEALELWVPGRMEERYKNRQNMSGEVRGVATYSRFRKFQVSTSEELAQ